MKRNWKLIYYSILSSGPIISKTFTNKPFQKGSHINNTFLKGGFYISKCQGKESLSYRIYHTASHLSNIRLNFQSYLISYVSFYYTVRSSLQIQRSVLLDDGTSRAHYLTPGRTCCEGFYQNYSHSIFRLFIVTEYNFTISVTQFALFRSLKTVLVLPGM